MTNLTEKWKQGKLPSGEYYVKDELGLTDTYKYYEGLGFADGVPQAVLAVVPSYEQWEMVYKTEFELLQQVVELKELLKECKHIMSIEKDFASCHFEKDKLCKLLTKINQVLGD